MLAATDIFDGASWQQQRHGADDKHRDGLVGRGWTGRNRGAVGTWEKGKANNSTVEDYLSQH